MANQKYREYEMNKLQDTIKDLETSLEINKKLIQSLIGQVDPQLIA